MNEDSTSIAKEKQLLFLKVLENLENSIVTLHLIK